MQGFCRIGSVIAVLFATAGSDRAIVPELRGEEWVEARQIAEVAGFAPVKGTYFIAPENWRDEIRADTVYLQSMRAGQPRGTKEIACWVFEKANPEQKVVQVPDVRGLSAKDAHQKLIAAGLKAFERSEDNTSEMTVAEQYPRAGQRTYEATSVFFTWGAP